MNLIHNYRNKTKTVYERRSEVEKLKDLSRGVWTGSRQGRGGRATFVYVAAMLLRQSHDRSLPPRPKHRVRASLRSLHNLRMLIIAPSTFTLIKELPIA